jgi:hypothetical protein
MLLLLLANTGQGHDHLHAVILDLASELHVRIVTKSRRQWLQQHYATVGGRVTAMALQCISQWTHVLLRMAASKSADCLTAGD